MALQMAFYCGNRYFASPATRKGNFGKKCFIRAMAMAMSMLFTNSWHFHFPSLCLSLSIIRLLALLWRRVKGGAVL